MLSGLGMLGIRLQLLLGTTVPVPAPFNIVDALVNLEVTNRDQERDGFQMVFSLDRDTLLDYSLLSSGLLDPPNRVIIMVFIGATPQVLIDGIITRHQVVPSNEPGASQLYVTGEDVSLQLDLEEKNATYPNQPEFYDRYHAPCFLREIWPGTQCNTNHRYTFSDAAHSFTAGNRFEIHSTAGPAQ